MTNSRYEFQTVLDILHARVDSLRVTSLTRIKINVIKYWTVCVSVFVTLHECRGFANDLRSFYQSLLFLRSLYPLSLAPFLFLPLIKNSYMSRDIVAVGDENNGKDFAMKCN